MRRSRGIVFGACGALLIGGAAFADETVGPWTLRAPDSASQIAGGGSIWAYINVLDAPVSIFDAFTGEPMLNDGYANGDLGTIVEVGWSGGVTNGPGPDLVMLDAVFDQGEYAISCDFDGFVAESIPTMVFSGESRAYYYQTAGHGPFPADIYGGEIDLSDLGVPDGDTIFAARFRTTNTAGDPVALAAIAGGFSIEVSGTCPGALTVTATGATAGGTVALVYARNTGSFTIPGGFTCGGTQLGVDATVQLVQTRTADGSGTAVFSGNAPAAACGGVIQAIDAATCDTSNVEGI
ncbi:MAG: hypothetical protein ACF8PN_08315 [Phycisphaerales bacterium]